VPLDRIQTDILNLLASHRDPESYVAGSTPLNRDAPRYSGDIDVFHDREERVVHAAMEDCALLAANGYALQWLRREPAFYAVLASQRGETTKLEWAVGSPCDLWRNRAFVARCEVRSDGTCSRLSIDGVITFATKNGSAMRWRSAQQPRRIIAALNLTGRLRRGKPRETIHRSQLDPFS